jgi:hypothetical protein
MNTNGRLPTITAGQPVWKGRKCNSIGFSLGNRKLTLLIGKQTLGV